MIPKAWVCLVLLTPALVGCLGSDQEPLSAADTGGPTAVPVPVDEEGFVDLRFSGIEHREVEFESPVSGQIHAEYYLPADLGSDDRVPVILEVSPYHTLGGHHYEAPPGLEGTSYDRVERFVERGYAVAYADARGFGGSSGCWDYYGNDEMADTVASVEWFAARPWSSGKVGMVGISYPGTTQLLAAVGQAEGLETIVPVASEPSVYENQWKNGVAYRNGEIPSGVIYAGAYPAIAAVPPWNDPESYVGAAHSVADQPSCQPESTLELSHPDALYTDYFAERDRQDDAHRIEASVFWPHGFWDQNVKPDEFVPMWQAIDTPKRAWFWHGYHQYPSEPASGREDFFDQQHLWLDHWLHGAENGIMDRPAVEVQDNLGRWRYEDTWPPADTNRTRFTPSADDLLSNASGPSETSGTVSFTTDPYTSFGGSLDGDGRGLVDHIPDGAHFTAASPPLPAPVHLAGVPVYDVEMASDRTRGQIVVGLFDVAPDGTWTLVDRGALDLRHREGMDHVVDVEPGETMELTFDGWPTDWVFEEGHRIATGYVGTEYRYVTSDASHTVTITLGEGTATELPIIGERTEFFDQTTSSAMERRPRMDAPDGWTAPDLEQADSARTSSGIPQTTP